MYRDIMKYSLQLQNLATIILEKIDKTLNIKIEEIKDTFEDGMQLFRMNYYPLCLEPEKGISISPHFDSTALTILLQLIEVEGLQIKKDGKWIPVKPHPKSFIINVGDILEVRKQIVLADIFVDDIFLS